ncbi:hypothetical protein [Arthrobacter sp. B1I2]|uniref:hypothetical protein n=1 Tax=Arthrobacter sp. B1I2 TaxID=3042263 RepID=UPI0027D8B9F5|nr:hypothetical protein [Arthrobacter sp. B1I2]
MTHQAKDVLDPVEAGLGGDWAEAPASTVPTLVTVPSLRPVVEDASALADHVVQAVPVINQVVPGGTVAAVVDPVVGTVDGVADSALGTVVPLASRALEPLDPVLEPIISAAPLPVTVPEVEPDAALPAVTDVIDSTVSGAASAATVPAVTELQQLGDPAAAQPGEAAADTAGAGSARALSSKTLHGKEPACDARMDSEAALPLLSESSPEDAPVHGSSDALPATPGATTGGSSSSSGGSAMPAWLSPQHFVVPAAGTAAVQGSLLATPAPVSFDPGSSPD